jgi:DNA-binding NtrC family response regulator
MARILLIDDDKDLVDIYRMMLEAKGHQITTAFSATQARQMLSRPDQFELVVLDVMMESLTAGFDLARDIHRRWPQMRMVVLSAIREATGVPFQFEPDEDWLPVVRFIEKSSDPQPIMDQIDEVLGKTA